MRDQAADRRNNTTYSVVTIFFELQRAQEGFNPQLLGVFYK